MKCRTNKTREDIVKLYDVKPRYRAILLNGQTVQSDAGTMIKNEYYYFEVAEKNISNESTNIIDCIICGKSAANHFLKLQALSKPPIFNPFETGEDYNDDKENNKHISKSNNKKKWSKVSRQLYNACNWVILFISKPKPGSPIFNIKDEIEENYTDEEGGDLLGRIKGINTIIEKHFKGKKLTDLIDEEKKVNRINESICDFSLIIEIIEKFGDTSYL